MLFWSAVVGVRGRLVSWRKPCVCLFSEHQNFFGTDEHLGPVAVSVRREKVDPEERTNNLGKSDYGSYQYRIICRTSEVRRLCRSLQEKNIDQSHGSDFSTLEPLYLILRVPDQNGVSQEWYSRDTPFWLGTTVFDIEGSQPEWCISRNFRMIYSRDTPFSLGTLDICKPSLLLELRNWILWRTYKENYLVYV